MTDAITVFAIVDVAGADLDAVRSAVSRLAQQSITELGCQRYDAYQSQKDPVRLVIHETWADEGSLDQHRQSRHIAEFKAAISRTTASVWADRCFPENEPLT